MKYACEAANETGAQLHFLGPEMDPETWARLTHETRMNIPQYLARRFAYHQTNWISELEGNR